MSNKIVPSIYRSVIDETIKSIKSEFDDYGVPEDVLADLQLASKWETKVIASHVAEFETHAPPAQPAVPQLTQHPGYPGVIHPNYAHIPYAPPTGGQPHVKSEPADPRYALSQQNMAYTLPPLPGPHIAMRPNIGGQTSVLSFPPGPPPAQPASLQNGVGTPIGRQYIPPGQQPQRIPQTDGPSESSDDAASPPVYAPRSSHPSLPQPQSQQASSSKTDDDAINSDLDDSDSENEDETEEGASGDQDIVFCTYDKVARVKSKWKVTLKDGMIHLNGRDYLFQKCTGEFEWY